MCDVKKFSKIYKDISMLQPEDTLQWENYKYKVFELEGNYHA